MLAAFREIEIKIKIVLFQIQYPLLNQPHLVHQEVVLLVALHQAPNHMVLRVVLPLPVVPQVALGAHMALRVVLPLPVFPQVALGAHTALREVSEVLLQRLRTL